LGARRLAPVIKQSNRYIACANAVADQLVRCFRVPRESIDVHYEMIDPARATAALTEGGVNQLRAKLGIPAGAKVVLGCGTFDWRKAPDLFMQVAVAIKRQVSNPDAIRFLWVGKINDTELARRIARDVQRAGLAGQFKIAGELTAPQAAFALADVFCLTSREDPFPLAMLEAAAFRKPVVCFSGSGGAVEFCAHGGGHAVPFLDTAAMAAKCVEWLNDSEARAAVGRAGAEAVEQRYTVDRVGPGLLQLIENSLASPPAANPLRARNASLSDIFASWSPADAPEPELVGTYVARSAVRERAQRLRNSGRNGDAVQACCQFLQEVLNTQPAVVILESLIEIGDELAPIDRAKSQAILADADKMARAGGITLQQFRARLAPPRLPSPNIPTPALATR
jgi:hypothetical protein